MYLKLFWKKQRTIVSTIVSFLHFFFNDKAFYCRNSGFVYLFNIINIICKIMLIKVIKNHR